MIITLVIIGAVILFVATIYNSLISKKNAVDNAFGSVDVALKKRFDLLPNLIELVKQYMSHEATTLTEIVKYRAQITDSLSREEKIAAYKEMTSKLNSFMYTVENYPNLKSNQNFILLQQTWTEIEEQISAARRFYNTSVTQFNDAVESFPSNIFANAMSLETISVFEIPETERQNISAKEIFNAQ